MMHCKRNEAPLTFYASVGIYEEKENEDDFIVPIDIPVEFKSEGSGPKQTLLEEYKLSISKNLFKRLKDEEESFLLDNFGRSLLYIDVDLYEIVSKHTCQNFGIYFELLNFKPIPIENTGYRKSASFDQDCS